MSWVFVLAFGGVVALAHVFAVRAKRREWTKHFKTEYAPHVKTLQRVLGPAYPAGEWAGLKEDAYRRDNNAKDFLQVFFGGDTADVSAEAADALSGVSYAFQEFNEQLGHPSWWWRAFRKWLDGQWVNGENHDYILRLWVLAEIARASKAPDFRNHRRLLKHRKVAHNFWQRAPTHAP